MSNPDVYLVVMLQKTVELLHSDMADSSRILYLLGRSTQDQGILVGARSYQESHGLEWQCEVRPMQRPEELRPEYLNGFNGIIGSGMGSVIKLLQPEVAVASLLKTATHANSTSIDIDYERLGELVAECTRSQYRALALVGNKMSPQRQRIYDPAAAATIAAGKPVHRYRADPDLVGMAADENLANWLLALPQATLVLTTQDREGAWFLDLCQRFKIAVPHHISVLGIDDDIWVCEQQKPFLSSVHIPWRLVGWHFARQLHRQLHGERPANTRIAPLRITERDSTLTSHETDDLVATVCDYLKDHMASAPKVGQLAQGLGVSRQTIYRRFRACLGKTVEAWWLEYRLDRAADELVKRRKQAFEVTSRRCGFASHETFRQAFRLRYGQSPRLYQRLHGGG